MVASFREFVEEKYFDEIYKQVNFYIIQNRTTIPFRTNRIDTAKYVTLEDAYFKRFYVHDYSKDKIGITIIVEV